MKGWWLLALVVIALLCAPPAQAREVVIRDIVVSNSSTDLLLFLQVVDAFSPEIITGVQSGLDATFTFDIRVEQVRDGWPDKEVARLAVDHILRFDTLKNQYRLTLAEQGTEEQLLDSEAKAVARMSELNGIKLLALKALQPDRQYVLKVRAHLAKKDLPSSLHYLIPFSNFWDVHTDWYAARFRF
jgi:hypothetical protein